MKRVLIVATVFKFLNFEKNDIKILHNLGYEIHTATNMQSEDWLRDNGELDEINVIKHQIDFNRLPFSFDNFKSFIQLRTLIKKYNFQLIHCHTPIAATIMRLAAIPERKKGIYVIYTSHGFHFHKKSSKKNWLFYYPIEKLLAPFTDMIITINKEDFRLTKNFKINKREYIPGVGVDIKGIDSLKVNRKKRLSELGIPDNGFVMLSIGELSDRKNQAVIIKAMAIINNPSFYYILCGTGENLDKYKDLAKYYGLEKKIIFTGQQEHSWVMELCHVIDVGVLPSKIEGLGLAGIEILAAKKPLIGANIHGINDYLFNNINGFSCPPDDINAFANAIETLAFDKELYQRFSENSYKIVQNFDISITEKKMKTIYQNIDHKISKQNNDKVKE